MNSEGSAGSAADVAVTRLVNAVDTRDFLHALQSSVRENLLSGQSLVALLRRYVAHSIQEQRITRLELARRVSKIVGMVRLSDSQRGELEVAGREWPAEIRNVLVLLLPTANKRNLFKSDPFPPPVATHSEARIETEIVQSMPELPSGVDLGSRVASEYYGEYVTVLLMGAPGSHDANSALLRNEGYSTQVIEGVADLRESLKSRADICGIVVDESFLSPLNAAEQETCLREIGQYSSLIWIRLACGTLPLSSARIRQCLIEKRFDRVDLPSHLICLADSRDLKQRELPDLAAARDILNTAANAKLNVKGVRDSAAHLLAASRMQGQSLSITHEDRIVISVELMTSGLSGTTVAIVQDGGDLPKVVKIDSKLRILDEARRFKRYIRDWDSTLSPTLHFHQETGLIAFRAIPDGFESGIPARSLRGRLEALWNRQYMNTSGNHVAERELLIQSTIQVAESLCRLNVKHAEDPDDYYFVNPSDSLFGSLESAGLSWSFGDDVRRQRAEARTRFRGLERVSTVHGDVHLNNILVTSVGVPYLIDYAASGPGHPCIDLVRLELALMLSQFRLVTNVADYQELVIDIHRGDLSSAELITKYHEAAKCWVNVVCIHGAVAARQYALKAATQFGGGMTEYTDTKLLTAWQSMAMHDRQVALCRAMIEALSLSVGSQ